jgi:hypothetical protein
LALALPLSVWQPLQVEMNASGIEAPSQVLDGAGPVGTIVGAPPLVDVAPVPVTGPLPAVVAPVPPAPLLGWPLPGVGETGVLEHAAIAAERKSSDENGM